MRQGNIGTAADDIAAHAVELRESGVTSLNVSFVGRTLDEKLDEVGAITWCLGRRL